MAISTFKFTINNTDEFKRLLADAKKEIVNDVGVFIVGEAQLRTPVDTGYLRLSISSETNGVNTVYIGTDVEYSEYVEFGTSWQSAQPYLLPAYEENLIKIKNIMRRGLAKIGK